MFPNREYEVDDRIAEKLIARGIASPVKKARKKKVTNRAVKSKEKSTPEDE